MEPLLQVALELTLPPRSPHSVFVSAVDFELAFVGVDTGAGAFFTTANAGTAARARSVIAVAIDRPIIFFI